MSEKRKSIIMRRGVLRFVCGQCGFEAYLNNGNTTYEVANYNLGVAGWRIEQRPDGRGVKEKKQAWVPVCNQCATPDHLLPPMPVTSEKFEDIIAEYLKRAA
jgi:hypothetical protein